MTTMSTASLVSILEAIRERCFQMEEEAQHTRAARFVRCAIRGDAAVQGILRSWVDGVVLQHAGGDPEVLCVTRILFELFVAEARRLETEDFFALRRFFLRWMHRCILRLGVGVVVGGKVKAELVFVRR